jgi:hypothetical protein
MRRLLPTCALLLALAAVLPAAHAVPQDAIWLCVDPDGHRIYQNSNEGPQCRRIDGIVATIPAAESAHARPARAQSTGATVTSASFPRVDAYTQRHREADRRAILEQELRSEQQRLAQLRAQGAVPDAEAGRRTAEDIERSEGNIAALQRELAPQRF